MAFGFRTVPALACLASSLSLLCRAQAPVAVKLGDIAVSASLRMRVEAWDWFSGNASNGLRLSRVHPAREPLPVAQAFRLAV